MVKVAPCPGPNRTPTLCDGELHVAGVAPLPPIPVLTRVDIPPRGTRRHTRQRALSTPGASARSLSPRKRSTLTDTHVRITLSPTPHTDISHVHPIAHATAHIHYPTTSCSCLYASNIACAKHQECISQRQAAMCNVKGRERAQDSAPRRTRPCQELSIERPTRPVGRFRVTRHRTHA